MTERSLRSSLKMIQMPLVRNAISRKRSERVLKLNSASGKISGSGMNQTVVPRSLAFAPLLEVLSLPWALPRAYSWR